MSKYSYILADCHTGMAYWDILLISVLLTMTNQNVCFETGPILDGQHTNKVDNVLLILILS